MLYLAFYMPGNRMENRRKEHDLGSRLLAHGLRREYGLPLEEIAVEREAGGKPRLLGHPEICFNISHCDGAVLCGISGEELGVDIERIRPFSRRLARRILTRKEYEHLSGLPEKEQAACFFRYWTLKESCMKALGDGLGKPFSNVEFSWDDHGAVSSSYSDCIHIQRRIGGRFQAAVCIKKERGKKNDL